MRKADEAMNIDVDLAGLNKAIQKIKSWETEKVKQVKDTINESALNVQKGARRRVRVATGRLRASITIEPFNGGFAMAVGTNVKYAKAVEFGSPARVIRAKRKKALYWPGASHPVKQVKLPAQPAKPFLFPAWEEEKPKLIQALKEALGK